MTLERLAIYRVPTHLTHPGQQACDTAASVDSFIALASFTGGSRRLGESTPSPDRGQETPEQLAHEYGLLARHGLLKPFLERNHGNPLVVSPILTCLDPLLSRPVPGEVAVCPWLHWRHHADIAGQVALLAEQGNKVVKVAIPDDLTTVQIVLAETRRAGERWGIRFRYDAHQALRPVDAVIVSRWLDHPTTEALAQPFPANAWQDMAHLYAACPVPLLLNESVRSSADVFRASGCADYIQLNLAKNGSPSHVLELVRQGRECGLKVILGSGYQGPVGCWLEGQLQILASLDNPGEMYSCHTDSPGGLVETSAVGFSINDSISWPDLERTLQTHSVQMFHIPVPMTLAACA